MTDINALQVKSVCLSINKKSILHDINFGVAKGEILCLLGPNGAGKTSLLKILSGQQKFHGDVNWQHQSISSFSIKGLAQQIAVVNQINDVVFSITLEHVVRMGLLPNKSMLSRYSSTDYKRVVRAIQAVGLLDKQTLEFSKLSGGEQQRGLIARALVQGSPLLILDEPVNHLDVFYQHQIMQLIRDLANQLDVTVVMSLHDLNLAAQYSDKLALLSNGKLTAFGRPSETLKDSLLSQVFNIACDVNHNHHVPNVSFTPEYKTVLNLSEWQA